MFGNCLQRGQSALSSRLSQGWISGLPRGASPNGKSPNTSAGWSFLCPATELSFALLCQPALNRSMSPSQHIDSAVIYLHSQWQDAWGINSLSDMPEKTASSADGRINLLNWGPYYQTQLAALQAHSQPSPFFLLCKECHSNIWNCFHGHSDQLCKWSPIKGRQNMFRAGRGEWIWAQPMSSSVQSLSHVRLFATPWIAARQASLSITNSQSLPKPMSIESTMPSNHLILCHPLLLLSSIFPSIRVFSSESVLRIRWPKYWSFSFNISPSNEHPGLISFRIDWLDLLAVHGTLKSLQHHSSKALILQRSAFFTILSHPYMTSGKP